MRIEKFAGSVGKICESRLTPARLPCEGASHRCRQSSHVIDYHASTYSIVFICDRPRNEARAPGTPEIAPRNRPRRRDRARQPAEIAGLIRGAMRFNWNKTRTKACALTPDAAYLGKLERRVPRRDPFPPSVPPARNCGAVHGAHSLERRRNPVRTFSPMRTFACEQSLKALPCLTQTPRPDRNAQGRPSPSACSNSLVAGSGVDQISAAERLTRKRTESILRQELRNRWVAPAEEFARLQIARLEQMILKLVDGIQSGELEAIDRALKIVDRLDRYHGFCEGQAPHRTIRRRRPGAAPRRRSTRSRTASSPSSPRNDRRSGARRGARAPGLRALVSFQASGSSARPIF